MTKTISILRIAILFIMGSAALALLLAEEQDAGTLAFILHVIADKAIAAGLIFATVRLYKRWSKVDPWLR